MTEAEAEAFLAATRTHGACISYVHEPDGSIRFASPARQPRPPATALVPADRLRRPGTVARASVKTAMAGALAACAPHGDARGLEIEDSAEPTGLEAAIYDQPQIPISDGPVGTPCDDAEPGAKADIEHVREPKRNLGRRPVRKKGKIKLDDRTMGFL